MAYAAQDYVETSKFLIDAGMQGMAALSGLNRTKKGRDALASGLKYTEAFARQSWESLSGKVSYAQYHKPTGENLSLSHAATAASIAVPAAGIVGVAKAGRLCGLAHIMKKDIMQDATKLRGWTARKVEEIKIGARMMGGPSDLAFETGTARNSFAGRIAFAAADETETVAARASKPMMHIGGPTTDHKGGVGGSLSDGELMRRLVGRLAEPRIILVERPPLSHTDLLSQLADHPQTDEGLRALCEKALGKEMKGNDLSVKPLTSPRLFSMLSTISRRGWMMLHIGTGQSERTLTKWISEFYISKRSKEKILSKITKKMDGLKGLFDEKEVLAEVPLKIQPQRRKRWVEKQLDKFENLRAQAESLSESLRKVASPQTWEALQTKSTGLRERIAGSVQKLNAHGSKRAKILDSINKSRDELKLLLCEIDKMPSEALSADILHKRKWLADEIGEIDKVKAQMDNLGLMRPYTDQDWLNVQSSYGRSFRNIEHAINELDDISNPSIRQRLQNRISKRIDGLNQIYEDAGSVLYHGETVRARVTRKEWIEKIIEDFKNLQEELKS